MGAFDGLNPVFAERVQALIAASGGLIGPGSGLRSVDEQIALRKKNGCPDVWSSPASSCRVPTAIPGRSNHNHGLAMDLKDLSTGRAVQGGSAADRWLAENAAQFGFHRPVKGEAWHLELVDGAEAEAAGGVGPDGQPIRVNVNWMDEQRKPEDELSHRLDSIMGMLTQKPPEADTPEQMVQQGELAQDVTLLAGGDPSTRQTQVSGGAPQGGNVNYNPDSGVEQWRPLVAQALGIVGEAPTEENIQVTLRRMQQESGGDPNIVNNWDSNAKKGTPSIGLMQVILPTFNAHAGEFASRGQRDPLANLVASMRYAKSRYGSLAAAYNKRGGY